MDRNPENSCPLLDRGPFLPLRNDTIRLWALHSLRICLVLRGSFFLFTLGVWGDGVLGREGKGGNGDRVLGVCGRWCL